MSRLIGCGGSSRRCLLAVVSAVLVAGNGVAVQERADFSGAWQVAQGGGRRGPAPGATMGSGWGTSVTIRQDETTLTVERVFFEPGDLQPTMKLRYPLDGRETTNTILMGRGMQEYVSASSWDGDTLVITTVHSTMDERTGEPVESVVVRRLSLEQSASLVRPPTLLVETTISGALGGPPTTTQTVYSRR